MNKKVKSMVCMFILGVIFITGCSASKSYESAPMEDTGKYDEMAEDSSVDFDGEEEVGFAGGTSQRKTNQKLIHRAGMNVEVLQKLEPLILSLQNFVDGHKGYIENMEQFRNGYDPITQEELEAVFMVIRIPHEHYNKALQTIADLGTVVNKTSSVEDVTLQYSDIESTLKMYKIEQDRLLEMLENEATDIKDMIEIEKRLSEVRIELEKQESARRSLDSLINYDTIELEMRQVRRTSDEGISKKFSTRIKAAFRDSVDRVIIFFQGFVLMLTYLAIPIIILITILGTLYLIVSKRVKRKKDKPGPKNENNAD